MWSRAPLTIVAAVWWALGCGGDDLSGPGTGELRVTTVTEGGAPDPDGYVMLVEGEEATPIGVNATVSIDVEEGPHTVELSGVAPTCALVGDARVLVEVRADAIAEIEYRISCPGLTGLSVTTVTTGGEPGILEYVLRVDGGAERPVGSNATLLITDLAPGAHQVELLNLPARCQVDGANPVEVVLVEAETVGLEFRVACRSAIESWTQMAAGTTADLTDVWGVSATDVFTIGERDVPGGIEGSVLHYDGVAWTSELQARDLRPRGLWGSSASDVYAVGYGFFSTQPLILHYDGTMWAGAPGFDPDGLTSAGLESVWGVAPDDIFAVGFTAGGRFDRSLIYHFNGIRWERMELSGEVDPSLADVWGSSGSNVYAVGRNAAGNPVSAVVLRYDGVAWNVALEVESITFNAVWGTEAGDVFAVGFEVIERGTSSDVRGVVWHFDGTAWSPMELPEVGVLQEVGGRSGTEVYVVGNDGAVLRYDGANWTLTRPAQRTLLGVWLAPDGQGFAVGNRGTLLRGR